MTVLRKLAALTAVALAPVGTASAAGCPQYRCTAAHAGGAASTLTAASAAQLKPAWAFRTGGRVYGSPALARGTLYVPSEDGVVYAVDAATGTQRWAFRTGGAVWSTPAVHRGLVIFGSADHRIYAVAAATGKLRWRRRTGGDVTGSPAISRGVVYVGSHDHRLYALDARTGRRRWRFTTGDRVSSSPAVAGGVVYFGSNDDHLYALDAATGRERWRFKADAWVWSAPAVAKGLVFFTSNGTIDSPVSNGSGGHMYALDAATGKLAWTDPAALNGFASPAVAGDAVVASGFSGVHAYGLKTGDSRWAYAPEGHTFASAFVTNGVVFAVDSLDAGDGSLVALDLATGATLGEVSFPRLDFVYSSPVASGDKVVFGTGDGVLRALSPTGQPGRETVARAPAARRLPFSEHRDVLGDMLDPGSVAELRLPGDGVARDATSSDPSGLNQDFTIFHGYTEAGRKVLLDVKGAGVLTDLYMYDNVATAPSGAVAPPACKPDPGGAVAPKIALYVDDDTEPLFDMNAEDFYCGAAGFPFVAPLAGSYTGSQWSHVPVPYRKHLMVVADSAPSQNNFYFDFFYTQFPDARGVQSFDADRDHARYQALIDRWNAVGEDPYPQDGVRRVQGIASLEPGQSAKLLDVTGGGQVQAVRFLQFTASPPVTTSPSNDPENDSRAGEPLKATRITGRWDDAPRPALDAPVGDFFGTGFGQAQNYDTILAGMHTATGVLPPSFPHPSEVSALGKPGGVSTYAFWPMPFAEHGELALTNTLPAGGPTVEVAYEVDYAPAAIRHHNDGTLWRGREELGYFHAREFHNRSQPANSPHPEREANDGFARLKGRGNYAGHVLNMTINAAAKSIDDLHYMEGDCMFWVDGAPDYLPDITSTGHEECHDAAPYFEFLANNPTADTTNRDACGVIVFCTTVGETSVFRWWMGDTIAFQHRFEATVEHGSENTYAGGDYAGGSLADESGVAFYYLQSAPIVLLPPARRCVSRRHFRIRLRVPQRGRVRSATVFVGKRRVAVRRGKRLTTRVNLRRLPKGRFVVRVRLRLRSGRTITLRRVYHTCAHHRPR